MIVVKILLGFMLAATLHAQGQATAKGWDHFYNLEFDEAIGVFSRLASESPKNASMQIHVAQSVLFRAMLKGGALESEMVTGGNSFLRRANMNPTRQEQQQFEDAIAAAMKLSEERLAKDANDTTGMYDLGVAYALRANYNFLVESRNGASALSGLVSAPRSSNRTCRFPASGSPTDFTQKHTQSFQPLQTVHPEWSEDILSRKSACPARARLNMAAT